MWELTTPPRKRMAATHALWVRGISGKNDLTRHDPLQLLPCGVGNGTLGDRHCRGKCSNNRGAHSSQGGKTQQRCKLHHTTHIVSTSLWMV